jgi:hypothetical protein
MNPPPTETTAAAVVETVKDAVTARSILNSIKDNRIELLLLITVAHLLGVSDRILTSVTSACF